MSSKQYHYAVVVTVDDGGDVIGIEYDAECLIGSSDGWVWNPDTETWTNDWDEGADVSYTTIRTMIEAAQKGLKN